MRKEVYCNAILIHYINLLFKLLQGECLLNVLATERQTPQITTSANTNTVKTTTDIIENNNDKLNEENNTTFIVGTVAGMVVVVSALIGFWIFVYRKRNGKLALSIK